MGREVQQGRESASDLQRCQLCVYWHTLPQTMWRVQAWGKIYAQPPRQLFIRSVDTGGFLFLPTESSAPWPKGALTGNWTQKYMHQKPNGICFCSGKREIEESRDLPSLLSNSDMMSPFRIPSILRKHPWDFIVPQLPHMLQRGMKEQRLFLETHVLAATPSPLCKRLVVRQKQHPISKQAVLAQHLRVASQGLPDFFDHLFCIP